MTREDEPITRIRKAHNLVLKAATGWNAGNLAAVEECVAALEGSAAELRAAQGAAAGSADALRAFRGEVLQIKERVAGMDRLSALAAAFLQGGPESKSDSPLYCANGFEDTDFRQYSGCSSLVNTGIQA